MSETKKNVGELKESYLKREKVQWEWKIDHFKFEPSTFFRYASPPFICAGNTWRLGLENLKEVVHLSLTYCGDIKLRNETLAYKLGLKKVDGDVEYFPSYNLVEYQLIKECTYYFRLCNKQSQKLQEKFAPQNILTIICTMRPNFATESKSAAPLKLVGLNMLSENLKQILTNKDSWDVTLRVKEEEFHAHKIILMARSPVFASMFRHDSSENQKDFVTIPDCDPDTFHYFLEYLYCGKLENVSFSSVLHLYSTADKYNVQELKSFCIKYMTHSLTPDNVCEVLILADLNNDEELFSAAKEFFHENTGEVVMSYQWKELFESESNFHLVNKLMIDMSKKMKMCHCDDVV